jgi:hypothetical protein
MEGRIECLYSRVSGPYNSRNKVTEIHSEEQNQLHHL